MKAAAFAWSRPAGLEQAVLALQDTDARAMAGGQSLGPMLNLRATRPATVVPLIDLADLHGVEETGDAITLGAATTHAAIADGRTPDFGLPGPVLARIAAGIAYRAIRTRGTIGGSLCHADPAADWLTTLTALSATVLTTQRALPLDQFITGPYRTALLPGEIVRAVRIPRPPVGARFGYSKLCRKPGEFAHAMVAVLISGETRIVIGAVGGPPVVLSHPDEITTALDFLDPVDRHLQTVAMRRALAEAGQEAGL